jgi:hypothetical protein
MMSSKDPVKMSTAMSVVDKLWRDNPAQAEAGARQPGDHQAAGMAGRSRARSAPRNWRAAERSRRSRDREGARGRQGGGREGGQEPDAGRHGLQARHRLASRHRPADRRDPAAPFDSIKGGELVADYQTTYTALRTYGVDADKASDLAVQRLQSTWGVSAAAGNQVMKNPPERSYPQVDGSHDWMQGSERWVAKRAGRNSRPGRGRSRSALPEWRNHATGGGGHDRRRPDAGRDQPGSAAVLSGRDQAKGRHAGHPAGPGGVRSSRPHRKYGAKLQQRMQAAEQERQLQHRDAAAMSAIDVAPEPVSACAPSRAAPAAAGDHRRRRGVFGAAFRQSNSVVSALQYMRNSGPMRRCRTTIRSPTSRAWGDPKYFLDHGTSFVGSQSPAETLAIKSQIDQEETDRKTLAAAARSASWRRWAPGCSTRPAAAGRRRRGRGARRAVLQKAAVELGKAGLMQTVAQEALLHATQHTRTLRNRRSTSRQRHAADRADRRRAAALLSPAERAALGRLHADRAAINEHAGNPRPGRRRPCTAPEAPQLEPKILTGMGTGQAMAAGAAHRHPQDRTGRLRPEPDPRRADGGGKDLADAAAVRRR